MGTLKQLLYLTMEVTSHGFVCLPNRQTLLLQTMVKISTLLGEMWMYAYHTTLSCITQAWKTEWGKGRNKKKEKKKSSDNFWLEWKWLCDVLLPPHCFLCQITPSWDEHLQCCEYRTWPPLTWGTDEEQKCRKGWRKKKTLHKFPNWYIELAGKPPGKVVEKPSA